MLLLVLSALIFIAGLIKRKSKVLFILQLCCIWLFMGWNVSGIDYRPNEAIYYEMGRNNFSGFASGWLFNLIAKYAHYKEWGFVTFNILTTAIAIFVIGYVVWNETKYPCVFAELFLLCPFAESIIQKRFFLGMAFTFLALYFLRKNSRIMFFSLIILAIGFHFSFIIYLPLFVWVKFEEKTENSIIKWILLIEALFLLFGMRGLDRFIDISKIRLYLSGTSYTSRIVALCYFGAQFIYIIIFIQLYKESEKYPTIYSDIPHEKKRFVYSLNKISLIICPLCLYESVFLRYYRVVLMYNYILLADLFGNSQIKNGKLKISKHKNWAFGMIVYVLVINIFIFSFSNFGLKGYIDTILSNAWIK